MKKILLLLFLITFALLLVNIQTYGYDKQTQMLETSNKADGVQVFTELIEKLEEINTPKIKLSDAYYRRGFYYKQDYNDLDKALADFNTALKYNPNNKDALFAASFIKYEFKDYNGALNDIKKLISLSPNEADLHYLAGLLYSELKQFNNAINAFTKSIVLKNKNPKAFYWRAVNELKVRQDKKAFQDLEYAKQQFYEMNDIENYRRVANVISRLNQIKAENVIIRPYVQPTNNQYFSNNEDTVKELKQINENLRDINKNMYMFPQNDNRDLLMLDFMFPKNYSNSNNNLDFRDLQILYGF